MKRIPNRTSALSPIATAVAWLTISPAFGDIVYTAIPRDWGETFPSFDGYLTPRPIDIDGDGETDLIFSGNEQFVKVVASPGRAVQAWKPLPLDPGHYCAALSFGERIDADPPVPLFWSTDSAGALITSCTTVGCIGEFPGRSAYLGVQVYKPEGLYYGYVELEVPYGFGGANLLGFAVESQPDTSMRAGERRAVPLLHPVVQRPGYLRLSWMTNPGTAYQIQYADSLNALFWRSLSPVLVATSTNCSVDLPTTGAVRFLRVAELR